MSEPIIFSRAAARPTTARSTRLDAIFASTEEALARAEAHLRRSQELRISIVYQRLLNSIVFEGFPQEASRH